MRRYRLGQDEVEAAAALPPTCSPRASAGWAAASGGRLAERVALRWDLRSLTLLETISYNREGWGICNAGPCLLTSDGAASWSAVTRRR